MGQSEAALLAAWSISTWFPDCVSNPPALVTSGADMDRAVTLLRLLSCVCRRSLVLGDIDRAAFLSLMPLHLTLLINRPGLSPKMHSLWSTSNYRGVYLFGNGQSILDVAGSKAIFAGMEDGWTGPAIPFPLFPGQLELPPLTGHEQAEIANSFQPKLLMYRLRNFPKVRARSVEQPEVNLPKTEMARNLVACLPEEADIFNAAAPLLQSQEQDALARRLRDPNVSIVEVLWTPLHETKKITVGRVTELTNALLHCRGERLEYTEEEIGWKLKNLGLYRRRNGSGMLLRFSREHSIRIHQLARCFGLNLPAVDDCPDCARPEVIATQSVV